MEVLKRPPRNCCISNWTFKQQLKLFSTRVKSYEIGKIKPDYVLLPNLRWPYMNWLNFKIQWGWSWRNRKWRRVCKSNNRFLQTYDRNINYDNLVDDWFFKTKFKNSFIDYLGLNRSQCHLSEIKVWLI